VSGRRDTLAWGRGGGLNSDEGTDTVVLDICTLCSKVYINFKIKVKPSNICPYNRYKLGHDRKKKIAIALVNKSILQGIQKYWHKETKTNNIFLSYVRSQCLTVAFILTIGSTG
jgi:hypothetical protein